MGKTPPKRAAPTISAAVERHVARGGKIERVPARTLLALRRSLADVLGARHPYFELLERHGLLVTDGSYTMLRPVELRTARRAQCTFFEGASFGDSPENAEDLRREQAFRATLVPFQTLSDGGDVFCFVGANRTAAGPLILDVHHDDFDLVTSGDALSSPRAKTVYTRSLAQHLAWVDDLATDRATRYPT